MTRTSTLAALLALLPAGLAGTPNHAAAQFPFDVTRADLAVVDTSAILWTALDLHTGGFDGEVYYQREGASLEECRAVAVLAAARMHRQFLREHERRPVSLRLELDCDARFDAVLLYDGLISTLVIREEGSGAVLYEGRRHGLP